jgi:hypothetical protein
MKNPCNNNCIVKVCCTQLCKNKKDYNDYLDQILDGLHPHIFSVNNHRRKRVPENIRLYWQKTIKLQRINNQEISKILNRIYWYHE